MTDAITDTKDDLGALEAAMTFLLNWGSRMLVTFPQPPVPVLASMEFALRRVDGELAGHLHGLGVGALWYGWPLLRSAFSEVLARDDWLRLFDRIFANTARLDFLEAAAVAFAVISRVSLLGCRSTDEAKTFFRRRQVVDIDEIFSVMDRVVDLEAQGDWDANTGDACNTDADGAAVARALSNATPRKFQPLPRGAYPTFDGYPEFAVDYQEELRQRIVRQERDVDHRRQLVRSPCYPLCVTASHTSLHVHACAVSIL